MTTSVMCVDQPFLKLVGITDMFVYLTGYLDKSSIRSLCNSCTTSAFQVLFFAMEFESFTFERIREKCAVPRIAATTNVYATPSTVTEPG